MIGGGMREERVFQIETQLEVNCVGHSTIKCILEVRVLSVSCCGAEAQTGTEGGGTGSSAQLCRIQGETLPSRAILQ